MSAYKKAINISVFKESAKEKIKQFESISMLTLSKQLGSSLFESYLALPDDEFVEGETGFVKYELLTASQRLRRDIETAQAYYLLYHAVAGLKEFELNVVSIDRLGFGEGDLVSSGATSIEKYQKMFFKMANDICKQYTDSGDIDVIVI